MIFIIFLGLIYALFISPQDHIQGDSVRIMYVHVPSSFIALGSFALIGTASILNLIFKIKATNIPTDILKIMLKFECNPKISNCFLIKSSTTKEKKPIMLENLRSIFYKMELSKKETRILSSILGSLIKKKVN